MRGRRDTVSAVMSHATIGQCTALSFRIVPGYLCSAFVLGLSVGMWLASRLMGGDPSG